jgi:hypothetical protein
MPSQSSQRQRASARSHRAGPPNVTFGPRGEQHRAKTKNTKTGPRKQRKQMQSFPGESGSSQLRVRPARTASCSGNTDVASCLFATVRVLVLCQGRLSPRIQASQSFGVFFSLLKSGASFSMKSCTEREPETQRERNGREREKALGERREREAKRDEKEDARWRERWEGAQIVVSERPRARDPASAHIKRCAPLGTKTRALNDTYVLSAPRHMRQQTHKYCT